jgi:hypothetical protein
VDFRAEKRFTWLASLSLRQFAGIAVNRRRGQRGIRLANKPLPFHWWLALNLGIRQQWSFQAGKLISKLATVMCKDFGQS